MQILYYDCFAGISGDMNLAAMIGLGVSPELLRAELSKLGLDREFDLIVTPDARHGIAGLRVDVRLRERAAASDGLHGHDHDHDHGHDHVHDHSHAHDHGPAPDHGHACGHGHGHGHAAGDDCARHGVYGRDDGHACGPARAGGRDGPQERRRGHGPCRNLADIEAIIQGSGLDDAVKRTSLAIFRKLAEAEARVHGRPVEDVHFHEVGAVDAIVDIVGAAVCYHQLGVDAVWASPVELGGGFVRCAHGVVPVPAPATAELLHGIPTTRGATRHETATPTGAAILATLASRFTAAPALTTEKTAYGIGRRDTDIPNVLRVHLARTAVAPGLGATRPARLLQCNIDDMTAEMLGVAMDVLLEKGAMDVHFTPILMKKNRPATCLSVLCAVEDEERFKALVFRHTTTLGIKSFALDKTALEVAFERLDTPLGPVTMKHARVDGQTLRSKPELEDCRAIARSRDIPLAEVYAAVARSGQEPKP